MGNVSLITRLVSCPKEFEALEESWGELYESSERATIFSSWDWLYTWWGTFSECDSRDLFILCFYDAEKLVGIAPFQIERKYPHTYIQGRTLRFLASGERLENSIATPFVDLLIEDGYEEPVCRAVESTVTSYQRRWDFAEFDFLLGDSLIFKCFNEESSRVKQQIYPYGYRYQIPHCEDKKAYLETLARRWQKDYRKKDRLFTRDGLLEVKTVEIESIDSAMNVLKDMHCDRWSGRADFLIFESDKFIHFHREILHRLLPKGKAYIRTLSLNGEALSSYYAFEDKGQVHYYQSAFYQKDANRYMPLFYLVCNEIGSAVERNMSFDFMFDDSSESYKKNQYAAEASPMYRLVWTPSRYRLSVFNLYKTFKRVKSQSKLKAPNKNASSRGKEKIK